MYLAISLLNYSIKSTLGDVNLKKKIEFNPVSRRKKKDISSLNYIFNFEI